MKRAYFVCVGNAGRSQMAQALYERLGGEARSAGSRPETELHPEVVEALKELDIDISDRKPKPISGVFTLTACAEISIKSTTKVRCRSCCR